MDLKAYESLPGIVSRFWLFDKHEQHLKTELTQAHDELDVYETSEQPNTDQPVYEDDSSSVQKILVSQKEAFDTFKSTDKLNSRYTGKHDCFHQSASCQLTRFIFWIMAQIFQIQ